MAPFTMASGSRMVTEKEKEPRSGKMVASLSATGKTIKPTVKVD